MSEKILITAAWPYANGPLHLGQIAGAYLPADIFARYQRLVGREVLMVSGTDQHGTPITIRAEQEKLTPAEIVDKYHAEYIRVWDQLGISFDTYTTTGTRNHQDLVHDVFMALLRQDLLYKATGEYPYCQRDKRFLPDRYVTGTCPICANPLARGDQCEGCGKPMNPQDLIDWACRICGSPPTMRESEHFFLRLTALQSELSSWVQKVGKPRWRPNVYQFTLNWLNEGLRDRAITRDIDWGVPLPIPGYENKRIYVWFEAVLGYLSASIEWALSNQNSEQWKTFWQDPECKIFSFIGKDNIPFHTIIFPAILIALNQSNPEKFGGIYNLPYDVPANEFLSLEGHKFSTSQNWAVWVSDFLQRYKPDSLRYYLAANMPESADSDFSWVEFTRRNNDELVATYGNLVHRVLTLISHNFDRKIPAAGKLDEADLSIREKADSAMDGVATSLERCRFREGISKAMMLASEGNRYIDLKAPWKTAKDDPIMCGTTLNTAVYVLSALKTMLSPYLPHASESLHGLFGLVDSISDYGWSVVPPKPGTTIKEPTPLFEKLDDSIVEDEQKRLESQRTMN